MPELRRPTGLRDTGDDTGRDTVGVEVVAVVVGFVVLGALGAVLWEQVTPLAEYTRTADDAVMGQTQLARQVAEDGWYAVIGLVAGLLGALGSVGLLLRRRRDPVLVVVVTAGAALLASFVMLRLGLLLGPDAPKQALASGRVPVGGHVPVQLDPMSSVIWLVWPVGALVAVLAVLWGGSHRRTGDDPAVDGPDEPEGPAPRGGRPAVDTAATGPEQH